MAFKRVRRQWAEEGGFALVELMVAIFIFTIALGMATELFISNLRSTSNLRERIQMLDNSDFVKSWLTSNIVTADSPPVSSDWQTLVVSSNSRCYRLYLDPSTHQLYGSDAATDANGNCPSDWNPNTNSNVTQVLLADFVANTTSDPLFVLKDKAGNTTTTLSDARQVEVDLVMDDPTDNVPAQRRTLTYTLGGVYLANQIPAGGVGTSDLADSSVTNQKIAPGAISGGDFQDGSVAVGKLDAAARASFVRFPIITGGSGTWTASSTSSWSQGPSDANDRAALILGDYCVSGKTLQARGEFVALNQTGTALELQFKLVRDDGQGGGASDWAVATAPTAANVPANDYGSITSDWQTIDCTTPETTAYFYSPQVRAGDSGSTGKQFSLISAALELRYQ